MVNSVKGKIGWGRELQTAEEYIRFFLVFIRELGLRKKSHGTINPYITKFYRKWEELHPPK